jgi:hypothetical protein
VSYDILVFYVYNKRRSDTYAYRVTIKPEAVKETAVDRIELVDDGLANVQLSWGWPESWWGSVKIEYSPPTPGAKDSPIYISNRRIPVRMGKKSHPSTTKQLHCHRKLATRHRLHVRRFFDKRTT